MAPLTATFGVDFSEFYDAVTKANVHLTQFEGNAGKVEKQLNRVANSFSGVEIQQEATIMAQAVEKVGGAARLTATEQAKVNAVVTEAIAKYNALGQTAPKALTDLAEATKATATETAKLPPALDATTTAAGNSAGGVGQLTDGLRTADKALGSMGVSIGPAINAIDEIGQASGKTVGELGKIATGALALSAGLAGWKLGRMVAEFFELDEKIGNATAALLGFGDVAAQTAGAVQDTLDRATKNAGRTITDYGEAIRINEEAVRKHADSFNTAAHRVGVWDSEIANVYKSGKLRQLEADMKSGNSTLEEMSRQYGISTRAIEHHGRQLEEINKKQKEIDAANEQRAKQIQSLRDRMFGTDAIKAAQDYVTALGPISNLTKVSADETERINKAVGEAIAAYARLGQTAPAALTELYNATIKLPEVTTGLNNLIGKIPGQVKIDTVAIVAGIAERAKAYEAAELARIEAMNTEQAALNDAAIAWAAGGSAATAYGTAAAQANNAATAGAQATTAANQALAGSFQVVTMSASQWMAKAAQLFADAERMSQAGGTGLGWSPSQYAQNLRDAGNQAMQSAARQTAIEQAAASMQAPWSRGPGMTITVNAMQGINGDQVANELVAGMRRRGVSPGGI